MKVSQFRPTQCRQIAMSLSKWHICQGRISSPLSRKGKTLIQEPFCHLTRPRTWEKTVLSWRAYFQSIRQTQNSKAALTFRRRELSDYNYNVIPAGAPSHFIFFIFLPWLKTLVLLSYTLFTFKHCFSAVAQTLVFSSPLHWPFYMLSKN